MTTKTKALSNPYGYFDAQAREYGILDEVLTTLRNQKPA